MSALREWFLDRMKLLGWALVFVIGVLLINPLLFVLGGLVSAREGVLAGIVIGLLTAGLVGFTVTALAMSRSSDLRRMLINERRKSVVRLYAAAFCVVAALVLEGLSRDFASAFVWPLAALVAALAFLFAKRMLTWGISQAATPEHNTDKTL